MVYSYLSLFFIPVLKWGRRYYVRTTCCNASVELDAELERKIQRGEITSLPENIIPDSPAMLQSGRKRCASCGFETEEDFTSYLPNAAGSFKERVTETAAFFLETEQYRLPSAGDWRRSSSPSGMVILNSITVPSPNRLLTDSRQIFREFGMIGFYPNSRLISVEEASLGSCKIPPFSGVDGCIYYRHRRF